MPNVIGLFDNTDLAHAAVRKLMESDIDRGEISVLSRNDHREPTALESATDAGGTVTAAGIGAAVGSAGGLFAGVAGLAIPGLGPIIAAGPLAAALGGALGGAGIGAAAGGLIGALGDMGVPSDEAEYYEDQVRHGKTLVVVRTADDGAADRAADILEAHGAADVEGRTSEAPSERPTTVESEGDPESRRMQRQDPANDRPVTVTEERIAVGDRSIRRHRVRVYARAEQKPAR